MKQTLEEAAIKHQNGFSTCEDASVLGAFSNGMHHQSYKSFIAGADWQAKQSPWISVEEKIGCNTSDDCIVMDKYGEVFRAYFSSENKWLKSDNAYTEEVDNVVRWMPIPSFDQILKSNKDVL